MKSKINLSMLLLSKFILINIIFTLNYSIAEYSYRNKISIYLNDIPSDNEEKFKFIKECLLNLESISYEFLNIDFAGGFIPDYQKISTCPSPKIERIKTNLYSYGELIEKQIERLLVIIVEKNLASKPKITDIKIERAHSEEGNYISFYNYHSITVEYQITKNKKGKFMFQLSTDDAHIDEYGCAFIREYPEPFYLKENCFDEKKINKIIEKNRSPDSIKKAPLKKIKDK